MSKSFKAFIFASTTLCVLCLIVISLFAWKFVSSPANEIKREVIYEVNGRKGFQQIADDLEREGVLTNARAFSIYARLTGDRAKTKRGEYAFHTQMRPREVLDVLISGKSIAHALTISEGLNIFDIAELLEKTGYGDKELFLKLTRDAKYAEKILGFKSPSLEGYLFPETYQITKYTSTEDLVLAMVRRYQVVWNEISAELSLPGWTQAQVTTLASIIEKETGAPEERPLISSVFHNRLNRKMKLQTDPTILYGMALERGSMPTAIGRADILRPTTYNTYVIYGLPPGPIANPGREALRAALQPAQSEYLFFVSKNDGTHIFSTTYAEHSRAVSDFQKNAKAREGKSWRDLKKNSRQ